MTTEPDDFFAELNAEIAKATAKSKLKLDAVALRKKAHNMRLSPKQRQEAADEFKAIQAIVEAELWEPVRSGALFAEQACDGCGSVHFNFLQFMQEERKVRDHRTRRWIRVSVPDTSLDRETIVQPLKTHVCSDCCDDHGFNVRAPSIRLLPRDGGLSVSPTYHQGDINDPSQEN
jgi:hypothetical protein